MKELLRSQLSKVIKLCLILGIWLLQEKSMGFRIRLISLISIKLFSLHEKAFFLTYSIYTLQVEHTEHNQEGPKGWVFWKIEFLNPEKPSSMKSRSFALITELPY